MNETTEELLVTLKKVATTLKAADLPFALAGGVAVYARGGPASEHDIDLVIREADLSRAVDLLVGAGMRHVEPPEDWLTKVYDEDRLVDLIHRPSERPVTDAMLARADEMTVHAVVMPVLAATDLLLNKLLAFTEHYCDFATVLPLARALREQIDWELVRSETAGNPYAEAFLLLTARLAIAPLADVGTTTA